jgi:Ca-activated chloride channel family protein
MQHNKRCLRIIVASAIAAVLCIIIAGDGPSFAQQGSFIPVPPSAPATRSQGGGSTLEVPLPSHQPGTAEQIPPIQPQEGQELTLAPHELRSQHGYEQVTVTVTNQHGRYESTLNKDDFKLYIDGVQRPIEFFRRDQSTPVSVGIIVDTSGSMDVKLPQARAAIAQFIGLLNDRDDVFLSAFSDRNWLLQPFTNNHRLVVGKLQLLNAYGQTALYDAIMDGLLLVRHGRWDKKALLVVTDGMDNQSQFEMSQIIAQARRQGVLIYSIGIGEPNTLSAARGPLALFVPTDEVDAATLQTLSTETGARTFVVRAVGDGATLAEDCSTIANELQQQYTVGFVAPDAARGGYRDVRVAVPGHPEDTVRTRKGVTVGANAESASSGSLGMP